MRHFLLYPFSRAYLNNKIFDSPYGLLQDLFAESGVALETVDRHELTGAEKILFFNFNQPLYERCLDAKLDRSQLVLVAFEPPAVIEAHSDPAIHDRFGLVFTHDDRLVDGERFRKIRYPQSKSLRDDLPTHEERRLITLINANKYSYVAGELYRRRRQAIRWFEKHEPEFDLYGHGWADGPSVLDPYRKQARRHRRLGRYILDRWEARRPYTSYRGSISDKEAVLSTYRFSICFENQRDVPGYVTEKIFDCLVCGTIPIYLGAPNIGDYLPADCFIDMRDFRGFHDLHSHLRGLRDAEVAGIREAGIGFLNSNLFDEWKPDAVFRSIVEACV